LRGAIYEMAKPETQGGYDLSKIPGAQQSERGRTMPFVNNHDTQRPELDGSGDYTGTWNSHGNSPPKGSAPLHPLVPTDPNTRIEAAYAIIFAVDGSPQISFEDLFDIGTTGKRFTHLPDNPVDLPVRDYLKNLIWSHEKLEFKKGAYKVRHQSADHLVIERSGKAIIGISDSWSDWQEQWIDTDFAPGTVLHDYSDANSHNIIVQNDKRVEIKTPPCNGTSVRRGYSVWGPAGQSGSLGNRVQRSTTQEWEMADDLGDSDPNSLLQGGALPAGQTATRRTCGKIFSEAGKPIVINAWKGTAGGVDIAVELYGTSGTIVANKIDTANPVTLNYTPSITGDYIIKIRNNNSSNPSQKVWVKATYTAPRAANLHGPSASKSNTSMAKENVTNPEDIFMATSYPNYFNQ
jgi:alpha-amylase